MFIVYKNKGILVAVYIIVSFIGAAILTGVLHRNSTGPFAKIDFYTTIGITFLFTAIWTYLTKDDYYRDKEGKRQKMDTANEFFWLSMKVWAIIFLIAAIVFFGNLVFNYFPAVRLNY